MTIQHTASSVRYITITGSNWGNPTITTSGGAGGMGGTHPWRPRTHAPPIKEKSFYEFLFLPRRCHVSGKRLWLEKAYRIESTDGIINYHPRWYGKEEYMIYQLSK